MNKSDLVAKIAQDAEVSKATAAKAFNSMLEGISESLSKGDSVRFPGFGIFSVKERAARTGRNPRTGEPIKIAAKKVVKFKTGKGLKDAV